MSKGKWTAKARERRSDELKENVISLAVGGYYRNLELAFRAAEKAAATGSAKALRDANDYIQAANFAACRLMELDGTNLAPLLPLFVFEKASVQ